MSKTVNFLTVDLYESVNGELKDYRDLKDLVIEIINENATQLNNFLVLNLSKDNDLHYMADIFSYEKKLFMRISSQKPSGTYLRRNYTTSAPTEVLNGISEDKEGIEIYTYALLDYDSGILAIVNQQSAPGYRIIDNFFSKYNTDYFLKFKPIPNPNGISRIYEAKEPKISQVEIEVPVPSAEILEQMFGWEAKDIINIQGHGLKATMKLSGIDRKTITNNADETKGFIDCIKKKISDYNKAKVRAKASGVRTQDYSFFNENFSYPIEIPTYTINSGRKYYYSSDELIMIYKENLQMAYNENKVLLKSISDR